MKLDFKSTLYYIYVQIFIIRYAESEMESIIAGLIQRDEPSEVIVSYFYFKFK